MIICTSICANYLPKAKVLGRSIKKHISDASFVVCFAEREIPNEAYEAVASGEIDYLVRGCDLGLNEDFNRFMFKHTIVEASTSIKGMLMKHLYERFPDENKFIYLDPDCVVFSDISELRTMLDTSPIVLCPHLMQPGHIDMEISSIKYGVYNLGFLAVNRDREALDFIDWWAERLYLFCYDDLSNGLFTDQRWVDLAPTFFNVKLIHHYGYDFGTWAVKDVEITKKDGAYFINNDPLRFAHFSGYDGGTIDMVSKWWLSEKNEVYYRELIENYSSALDDCGQQALGKIPWSYACYYSGDPISKEARIKYREENKLRWTIDDPFKYSDEWLSKKLGVSIMKNEPEWAKRAKKAIDIWVNEGFISLTKKLLRKMARI
ncbi:glycosyltransferase [Desulforamulus aeronauticus]|uniref:Glycosyl transferase family 8 n=1 Tax=Desulforamulus aeronauticus DSM 10349 TaxID=1121421 RepID=A0A1M6T520_9FIRM|nr:glycosyltransferase [Desulforamulus aeronauticus]SHK52020.1 hypothetical protein SAMN02745123_02177 [Desulforamulus aeronauticus DSM 10349]